MVILFEQATLAQQPVFVPYGGTHWAVLALGAGGAVFLIALGRRHRGRDTARVVSRGFAVVLVAFQLPFQVRALTPAQWDLYESLPFQLSDLAWIVAAYALWSHRWWAFALTYYWGLTLTPQAMFTPALDAPDFPHVAFVEFWGHHLFVAWAALYLTWGVGLRPTWRSVRVTLAVTLAWAVCAQTFNAATGANYGFLDRKPANPSLLDVMGPWPSYIAVEFVAVVIGWALITWPWVSSRRRARADTRESA